MTTSRALATLTHTWSARAMAAQGATAGAPPPFVLQPHDGGFRPGLDLARLNQLLDDLETQDFVREAAQ